jgi:hypothetical protein
MQRVQWKAKTVLLTAIRRRITTTHHFDQTKVARAEKRNPFGIPLISDELNKILFGDIYAINDNEEKVQEALEHLKSFNVNCYSNNENNR